MLFCKFSNFWGCASNVYSLNVDIILRKCFIIAKDLEEILDFDFTFCFFIDFIKCFLFWYIIFTFLDQFCLFYFFFGFPFYDISFLSFRDYYFFNITLNFVYHSSFCITFIFKDVMWLFFNHKLFMMFSKHMRCSAKTNHNAFATCIELDQSDHPCSQIWVCIVH